ncbi:MAG: ATP-binding protein [Verrucomicrobia bacterium]|nr:ATP-binding protein [Verrucomicrobiota bacterium]
MNMPPTFPNPFRPGAGHPPPYLAGRETEMREFSRLLEQSPILANLVLTGLRGVGKTVLLETFKPIALKAGWMWTGTDLSESASVTEENIAIRLLADLSPLVANIVVAETEQRAIGFSARATKEPVRLDFEILRRRFVATPGLAADKLKATLELVWASLAATSKVRGIVLAYDEAQNLSDHAETHQYPLSLLLDVFQSLQKKDLPFLLVLTGLPTLFPKLVAARTYTERMFHVATLGRLTDNESRDAILKPIQQQKCPVHFTAAAVEEIIKHSGGYPYFIQFLCREIYDSYLQQRAGGAAKPSVTVAQVVRKLDSDFFAGRWNRVTDRQREFLTVVAQLPNCDEEFTVQEIVERSKVALTKPFSASHVNQILAKLAESGLVYKNRHGRYSFAVPLLGDFIRRDQADGQAMLPLKT